MAVYAKDLAKLIVCMDEAGHFSNFNDMSDVAAMMGVCVEDIHNLVQDAHDLYARPAWS